MNSVVFWRVRVRKMKLGNSSISFFRVRSPLPFLGGGLMDARIGKYLEVGPSGKKGKYSMEVVILLHPDIRRDSRNLRMLYICGRMLLLRYWVTERYESFICRRYV